MIRFTATIQRFDDQGEKTGWTYIFIPKALAEKLEPGNRRGFRVKGRLDDYDFEKIALIPMGGGDFILTLNATIRKAIKKQKGATVEVQMEVDKSEIKPPMELLECLADEPEALAYFKSLTKGHQNYFTNWINSAKTEPTKAKRIAATIDAMVRKWDFGQMIRAMQAKRVE